MSATEQERAVVAPAAPTHLRRDVTTIVVLLAVGLLLGFSSLQEGLGTPAETGSGFFPLVACVALIISGVVALLEVLRGRRSGTSVPVPEGPQDQPRAATGEQGRLSPELLRLAGVMACAALVPLLGETVGFVTTLTGSVGGMAKIAGLKGWARPAATGILFGSAVWGLFVTWLNVPLPIGLFGMG